MPSLGHDGISLIQKKSWTSHMQVSIYIHLLMTRDLTNLYKPDIQGIDQLVEKFRNSSVMDQDPAYRPKVPTP